jgi:hypothetical protein
MIFKKSIYPTWYEGIMFIFAPLLFAVPMSFVIGFNTGSFSLCVTLSVLFQLFLVILGPALACIMLASIVWGAHYFLGVGQPISVGCLAAASLPISWSGINFCSRLFRK